MGIAILLTATFVVHSPLIHAQSPAVQKAVRLLGERNEAAIAKIKTLMCSYRTEDVISPQLAPDSFVEFPYSGQYFRKGNDFYTSRWTPEGNRRHWHITLKMKDRVFGFQLTDNPIENPIQSYKNYIEPTYNIEFTTLWERFLIKHYGYGVPLQTSTFLGILSQPILILHYRNNFENNKSSEYVKILYKDNIQEFWFDSGYNYLIRKTASQSIKESHSRTIREITEVQHSHDDAIIPTVIDTRMFENGRIKGHARTILTDVHLNSQFHFTGLIGPTLEGSLCDDHTRNTRYLIDGIGNPIGPETIIPPRLPPEKRLYRFDLNVEIPPNGGSKETLSKSDLAIYTAAVLASLVTFGWLIRNQRRKLLGHVTS